MKTTILIGYAKTDASGNPQGPAKVISGPPADDTEAREQAHLFADAKQLHRFPKGVKYLAFGVMETTDVAIHISNDVAEQIEGRAQVQFSKFQEAEKKEATRRQKAEAVAAAKELLSKAAVALNNASAALQTAKHRELDAQANFKATQTESHKTELAAAKQKVVELTEAETKAREELNAAKAAKLVAETAGK